MGCVWDAGCGGAHATDGEHIYEIWDGMVSLSARPLDLKQPICSEFGVTVYSKSGPCRHAGHSCHLNGLPRYDIVQTHWEYREILRCPPSLPLRFSPCGTFHVSKTCERCLHRLDDESAAMDNETEWSVRYVICLKCDTSITCLPR